MGCRDIGAVIERFAAINNGFLNGFKVFFFIHLTILILQTASIFQTSELFTSQKSPTFASISFSISTVALISVIILSFLTSNYLLPLRPPKRSIIHLISPLS